MLNFIRGGVVTAIIGCLVYGGLLVHTSRTSHERILPMGEAYHFCGLYLDCHLSAAVDGVDVTDLPNGGRRYTVRLRFASDAARATLVLSHPEATLLDANGRRFGPVEGPHGVELIPKQAILAEFVFESPEVLSSPRLQVAKGGFLEKISERLLVGDPDSFGHAPVTLALSPSP